MSLIQSSTTTLSSPYASMTATSRPRDLDPNGRPPGGPGVMENVASAIEDGASATVSFSSQALGALEGGAQWTGQALDTGAQQIGSAVYDIGKAVIGAVVQGGEDLAAGAWNAAKAGLHGAEDIAADAWNGAKAGVSEAADVAEGAWHLMEAGASDVASAAGKGLNAVENGLKAVDDGVVAAWHGIENSAGRATTLASEMTSSVVAGGRKALDVASDIGSAAGDAAMTVVDGAGSVASSIASYATLGAAAGQKLFTAVV